MVSVIGNKEVNPGVEYDAYKDSGMEIYARLMQMRKDLALDADKVFTLEDVAAMRRKCMEKRAAYENSRRRKTTRRLFCPKRRVHCPAVRQFCPKRRLLCLNR